MTDALIRRAGHADLAAIALLRREWTEEEHGDIADPDFDENLAAWFARELSRRIMWLAEEGGRPVGMMNLAIYERMPRPGRALSRWGYLGNVFVLAAYRNRGIGGQLVSYGSCRSLFGQRIGVGLPALVSLPGAVLVAAAP
jgi:GNAT superfamily N-acetyltransferase